MANHLVVKLSKGDYNEFWFIFFKKINIISIVRLYVV